LEHILHPILQYWFGQLDEKQMSAPRYEKRWFTKDEQVDRHLLQHFGDLVQQAIEAKLTHLSDSDQGLIALILLLDQFTRNIHRNTPAAFAGDALAVGLAQDTVDSGRHHQLPIIHRVFLYIPFEHSEDLGQQETGVQLFEALANEANDPRVDNFRDYARAHRDVIARFGRFPHRNDILGRPSNEAELAHLKTHGGF